MRHLSFMLIMVILIFIVLPVQAATEDAKAQKVYNWLKSLQQPNGLLESTENSNFVSLYDNSLAAILFSVNGDFDRAEKIFDFFTGNIDSELKELPGGFGQFRDCEGFPAGGRPHRWLGDNAWLLIAINNYHHLKGNKKYNRLAVELEKWIRSLLDKQQGGVWGGYNEDFTIIPKVTEGTIDAFNAVAGYDSFHKNILHYLKNNYWDDQEKIFLAWKEHPQYKYALDLNSWGYCGIKDMPADLLKQARKYKTTKIAAINQVSVTGFCFDTDVDTIWLEGTGQMVVAYHTAGMNAMAEYYLAEMEKMIVDSPNNPKIGGIPYATNMATGYGEGQLWEGADINPCVSSSVWYLLGKLKYDPLKIGRNKNIPQEERFF